MNQINSLLESYINMFKNDGKLNLFNLQPGQIVRGQVLELIGNNNALVAINNNKLLARLEIPLIKGQSSWFVVTSVGDEIKLKILADDSKANKAVTDLHGLMNKLEIKNTGMNKTILNEIIKMEIPLEKDLVKNITSVVKDNQDIGNVMQAVKLLNTKNMPTSSNNILSINEFFQNYDLINKLSDIKNDIQKILVRINNDNVDKLSISKSTDFDANKTVSDNNMVNLQNSDKMIFQLQRASSQIEDILDNFKYYNNSKTIDINHVKVNNELENFNIEKIDSKQILMNITKYIDLLQQQYSPSSIGNNLIKGLEDILIYKSNLPAELTTNIERTVNHIIGQNIALVQEQSLFSQTILQFPGLVSFSGKPVFIQIHTKREENSNNIDPEDIMLIFLFDLDNLGDLMVQLKILHKQLFLQINNDNPNIKSIINILEPEFINFIEKSGYQTTGLSVTSIKKKQNINNSSYQSVYEGVDIKI